jgi:4-hydroxybenzoyl-CoA thioesterase
LGFTRQVPVRFDDVDYARIVYFPKLFGYCHEVFEDFFAAEVGVPYATLIGKERIGFPSVHAEADFKSPLRFGQTCSVELVTEKVGNTSLTCRYTLTEKESGLTAVTAKIITVCTHLDEHRAIQVPAHVRAAFERHLALAR